MKHLRQILLLLAAFVLVPPHLRAADTVDAVIAKARAAIGPEAALNALKTVHFVGSMEVALDGQPAEKKSVLKLELIVQKPCRQHVTLTSDKRIETTCLDEYEAWQRSQSVTNPADYVVLMLPPKQVKNLRVNTWENLNYFRGIDAVGGHIEDHGLVEIDGVKCRKLTYVHSKDFFYARHFAATTGRLVLTETEQGAKITEAGEIRVAGLRFPKQIISRTTEKDGTAKTVTITFDRITLNEEFPDKFFEMPSVTSR